MTTETVQNYPSLDLFRVIKSSESPISRTLQNAVASLDRYIERHRAGLDSKPFKERQLTVFRDMRNFLNNGGTEGYIELPCAVGKTVLYTKFIDATRLKTLIVTDRILSINQTEEKLETFAEGLDVGKIYHAVKEFGREVTITTYDSLRINIKSGELNPEDFQLLILDEFDRAGPKTTEAIQQFTNSIKLGFSATLPSYTFLKEIHTMGIKEAVEEGLNCGFSVILAKPRVDLTNVPIDSTGEFDEIQLGKTINIVGINQPWVELYKEMFEGKFALVYCAGIEHAKTLRELFAKNGIPAGFISGKNSPNEQREILRQFKNGEIKVLCSADILIRAYDEPKASIAFNIRPTFSPRVAKQRSGRVLRNDPDDPAKHAHIVDAIYETGNTKKLPISFAQIAGSAHITADKEKNDSWETAKTKTIPLKEENRRKDYKENEISGLKIIFDAEEVLRVVRERQDSNKKPELEGWKTKGTLKKELQLPSYNGLQTIVEIEGRGHPDWFKKVGKKAYIAPQLIERVTKYYSNLERVPEGWLTIYYLITNIIKKNKDSQSLRKALEKEALIGEIKRGLSKQGIVRTFFAPELVDRVMKKFSKIEAAHEGEVTSYAFAKSVHIDVRTAEEVANRFGKEHPESVEIRLDSTGRPRRHYPLEELQQMQQAGEGSITVNAFRKKFKIPYHRLEGRVRMVRQMYPDLTLTIQVGKNRTYLTRQMQEILSEYYSNEERVFEAGQAKRGRVAA